MTIDPHELLDDALGCLDDECRARLDRLCAEKPDAHAFRLLVRERVSLLIDDGDDHAEPPVGLSERTLAFVSERIERPEILRYEPPAPPATSFRWSDLAVAAGLLLTFSAWMMPQLAASKRAYGDYLCRSNLMQIGRGLSQYLVMHNAYPFLGPKSPGSYAGGYAVMLNDHKLVSDPSIFRCPRGPSNKPVPPPIPSAAALVDAEARTPGCYEDAMGNYAYSIGYHDRDGQLRCYGRAVGPGHDGVPVLADAPPTQISGPGKARLILTGNSPNHGGVGQNVLYRGGNVGFRRTRAIDGHDNDLYTNERGLIAPGVDERDSVLAHPGMHFQP